MIDRQKRCVLQRFCYCMAFLGVGNADVYIAERCLVTIPKGRN
ncbi:hypothetical protein [uncultured Veillonella sp.]|nr:hypothetical protein [uncultured Veillonella sp.]